MKLVLKLAGLLSAGVLILGFANSTPEDKVRKLSERFVRESLALSPVSATQAGYHEHKGAVLDDLLDDNSAAGLEKARKFFSEAKTEALSLGKGKLSRESAADLDVIRLQCDSALLEMDQLQSYRHNPTGYVETIGNALYAPYILHYEPVDKRFAHIIARLQQVPGFLRTARENLRDSPEIWNQVAREENEGNIDLIQHTLAPNVPVALKPQFGAVSAIAVQALNGFNEFLKKDLSQHTSPWQLGSRKYAAKFKLTLVTGDTPEQALADAEAKLESIRQEMKQQATAVYPKFFPGQALPDDLNTVVSQVLDKVAQQHATKENYFADAKQDLAEATEFVRDHHLLKLPARNNLEVIPTPEFMRGIYAVGGFSSAPPMEPQLGAFYWITPMTPDMTAERVESKLREYNRYGLKILTIHEAMPGHYVQAEYANDIEPKWQGLLRTVFSNTPYVEGWAVYATQLLIDQGYQKTPEMQLTFGKQMLRVVSNTILDIKLQTMNMTDDEAVDLMIKETFQEREEAMKKLQRAKLSSCQLPAYFVGWRGWDRLRDDYQKKAGPQFDLAQFHERALQEGALPLPVLRGLLMQAL